MPRGRFARLEWQGLGSIVDASSVSGPRRCRCEIFVFRLLLALLFTVTSDLSCSADKSLGTRDVR